MCIYVFYIYIYYILIIIKSLTEYIMSLEALIGKEHFDYKTYRDKLNVVIEAIDEIAFLSNTLDYERLIVFFKEVIETFDYYKNIDENDDNSEGFSNMNNKENLLLNIIDSDEYNNLINFLETYKTTIIRKSANLKQKIEDLIIQLENTNSLILDDLNGNIKLINYKIKGIADKLLENIDNDVPSSIDENKLKFDVKIITKNDIICILSSYKFLKNLVYKQMHVIDREYYTATKEDIRAFRKELYILYQMLCGYFNKNKNSYVEDISKKFQEVVKDVESLENKSKTPTVVAKPYEKPVDEAAKDDAKDDAKDAAKDAAKDDEEELSELERRMIAKDDVNASLSKTSVDRVAEATAQAQATAQAATQAAAQAATQAATQAAAQAQAATQAATAQAQATANDVISKFTSLTKQAPASASASGKPASPLRSLAQNRIKTTY